MNIKEKLNIIRRNIRYYLIMMVVAVIQSVPFSKLNKLKMLFIKAIKLFGAKELKKAYNLIPEEFSSRKKQIIDGMVENIALIIIEFINYDKIKKNNPNYCKIENWEIIEKIQKEGKVPLLLVGHFCNWEVLGFELVKAGLDLTAIARPNSCPKMTDYINSIRAKHNLKIIMQNNIHEAIKLLNQNKPVAILSDLNAKEWGYQVDFFGRKASFYSAPVIISVRSKMPLIPVFPERQANGNIIIKVKEPIVWKENESMKDRIQKYAKVYEEEYRKFPEMWLWIHDKYKSAEKGKLK